MIESTPKVTKPDLPQYPLTALNLFPDLTRESYEKAFGIQPPPFDANRPPKLWFDTSATAGNYIRLSINPDMSVSFPPMTMTQELAASVNLPGAYRYAKRTVAPTAAVSNLPNSDGGFVPIPVPADQLSTAAEAAQLAAELGGIVTEDRSWFASGITWGPEQRRMFEVVLGTVAWNVGYLLQRQAINGVGAPGAWKDAAWIPATQATAPLDPNVKAVPVPVRTLDPDEEIVAGFGNVPMIRKRGAFTAPGAGADANTTEILRLVRILLTRFSVPY